VPPLHRIIFILSSLLGTLIAAGPADAHFVEDKKSRRPLVEGRELQAVRLPVPPTIDGRLDPEEWSAAAKVSQLHQTSPGIGVPPTRKTDIWVGYDTEYIYVGVRAHDEEPGKIVANRLLVDAGLFGDDRFVVQFSPFNNQRTGYRFETNPNGVRRDGLIEGPNSTNSDWNAIWDVAASIDGAGWVAEYRIPFKTLNFDPKQSIWGISFERAVVRDGERMAWTSYNGDSNVQAMGIWRGVEGAEQGLGLDIIPGLTLIKEDFEGRSANFRVEPTLDAFFNVTPSLTAALTVNTDFSTADVDDQIVNLTRFSVLFPERRDFFLRDNDVFQFANLGGNGNPFFSRRIGLDDNGAPVALRIGGKLTGRVGDFNVGVLNVLQERGDGADADANLFVGRVSLNVLENSQIGAIFTHGDPVTGEGATTLGFDALYRSLTLIEGKEIAARAYWLQTSRPGEEEGSRHVVGGSIELDVREGLEGEISFQEVGNNYDPSLGFVNREGTRSYGAGARYFIRPPDGYFRSIRFEANYEEVTDLNGRTQSRDIRLRPIRLQNQPGDQVQVTFRQQQENLDFPFEIIDGVVIPAGDYEWERIDVFYDSSPARRIGYSFFYSEGDFFTGDRSIFNATLRVSPSKYFTARFGYDSTDVDLPNGEFISRIFNFNADVALDAEWSWVTRIQYDNISDSGGINSRLRYNPAAGQDLFLVLNQGFRRTEITRLDRTITDLDFINTALSLRLLYTFRF